MEKFLLGNRVWRGNFIINDTVGLYDPSVINFASLTLKYWS